MKNLKSIALSKPASYGGLILGWLALAYSDRAPEFWRTPLLLAGGGLFIWAWMKVSPCAGGRCQIPPKE